MITGHGNDIYHGRSTVVVDFSSNTASPHPHEKLISHLAKRLPVIENYPETNARSLREKLAQKHLLKNRQIVITNGSTEAFYLVAAAFTGIHSLVLTPSFSEYEDACRMHQHQLSFEPVSRLTDLSEPSADLIWLGRPNNPDGVVHPVEFIEDWLSSHPETLMVIDEAYGELCSGFESALPLVADYNNLIVICSMTKLYSIPGIRLGYLAASEKLTHQIGQNMQPWNVNALAIEAGKYILDHEKELAPDVSELLWQSRRFQNQLSLMEGLKVTNSNTNYFLVELGNGQAADLKTYLLNHFGFLIRDASNFRGLNERFFRLAVQSKRLNTELAEAIGSWLSQQP